MIGTSTAEFAFIRACIHLLHSIAPASLLYCAAALTVLPHDYRLPTILELWLAAEALFFTCFFIPWRWTLQHDAVHPPRTPSERRKAFDRVKSNIGDPERYLCGWFKGAKFEDIGREDVKTFLAWAFFDRDYGGEEQDEQDNEEIEEYVLEVEAMLGKKLRPGKGPAKSLRLTLDPVDMLHRSLLWYTCVGVVDFLTYLKLHRGGFHLHRLYLSRFPTVFPFRPFSLLARHSSPAKHLSYWHKPHTSKTRLPILFIHGIGIGLYPYTSFLSELEAHVDDTSSKSDGQVGILAVEIMSISFRITSAALSKDDLCAELEQILTAHGYDRFVLVSHSYGSVISTHIISNPSLGPMVASMVLIDPVSILLHMPDVAYNFTRRQPKRANEWQLWYFASMDPGVAHSLGRRFFWNENVLWKEDIKEFMKSGRQVTVSLAGQDLIVDTDAVGSYLINETPTQGDSAMTMERESWKRRSYHGDGLGVLWFDELDHAQVFDKAATRARLVEVVSRYCKGRKGL